MFRLVKNKKNILDIELAKQLLKNERRAVLAVNGDDGYPYAIPLNFLYSEEENKIYFHGSRTGHKIDSLKNNDKACLTVYGNETIKDETWAPYVQSVVAFGRCKLVSNQDEAIELVKRLAEKYYPDKKIIDEEVAKSGKAVQMIELTIEHISGKEILER